MGYRVQNNYDASERAARKQLPWRDRYNWRIIVALLIAVTAFVAGLFVRLKV